MSMKYTKRNGSNLVFHGWLRLGKNGSMELTRQQPALGIDERRCKIAVSVPASIFQQPELHVNIAFDGQEERIPTVELRERVQSAIENEGFGVFVTVKEPEAST